MSQTLLVELSDDVYAVIERQATKAHVSPVHLVATSLEQQFRQGQSGSQPQGRSATELQAARARFEHHFRAVDLGYATGSDNEHIDADLTRASQHTHEDG